MGISRKPQPVRLFASILFQRGVDLQGVLTALAAIMGPIKKQLPAVSFTHTHYYQKEMGPDLLRTFVLFEPFVERDILPEIKIKTNDIESSLSSQGNRIVNIDPGYIALEHVILATTKGYAHRVYLRDGIYADLTLRYIDGAYRGLDWTYPDYKEMETISLFKRWREDMKGILKCQKV